VFRDALGIGVNALPQCSEQLKHIELNEAFFIISAVLSARSIEIRRSPAQNGMMA
jgi:hypothetical protein